MANRLASEQSPYLLQHAHNPVDWYPWGDEAFQLAKQQNKPVIVSIGYAACHWCHVMERESFENADVAAYMNEHFICIKVDREEHPDVDHMYMDAVQAISGSGGWPLNVFATPDRIPFYGGTYYPPRAAYNRPSWIQLLQRMHEVWTHQHDEVTQQAEQMINHLRQAATVATKQPVGDWNSELCDTIAINLLSSADKEKGGFGNAPKFPGTMAIGYLLDHYHYTGHEPSLQHALKSLDAMADGGIYDQLGGGFARYSTDREWLAPHFEKMLYDNALLIGAYADACILTGDQRYADIIKETIDFAERELKHTSGLYYCALDADSEGEEGKFYTWTWDEWTAAVGDEPAVADYYGVVPAGNWEHTNILHTPISLAAVAARHQMTEDALQERIASVRQKLWATRALRLRPLTDDKCLLSWNALMNIALVKAAGALGNKEWLSMAAGHMQVMHQQFVTGTGIRHTWKNGVAKITAKLDDMAYLIRAMLDLASATGDDKWATEAIRLTEHVVANFSADNDFFYFTPAGQTDIPVRKVDLYDGATPSPNAVMAHNLWTAGMLAENTEWIERGAAMWQRVSGMAARYGYSFSYWARLAQADINGLFTVVMTGKQAPAALAAWQTQYHPGAYALLAVNENSGLPLLKNKFFDQNLLIFVCSQKECLPPFTTLSEAVELVNKHR